MDTKVKKVNYTELLPELPYEKTSSRFPDECYRAGKRIRGGESKRKQVMGIAIDSETTKDIDDVINVFLCNKTGNYKVQVSIADVSTYIKPSSVLDFEAKKPQHYKPEYIEKVCQYISAGTNYVNDKKQQYLKKTAIESASTIISTVKEGTVDKIPYERFHQLLKVSIKEDIYNKVFVDNLNKRIESGRLQTKDFYYIIFLSKDYLRFLDSVRLSLEYFKKKPEIASSIVDMAIHKFAEFLSIEHRYIKKQGLFYCQAVITCVDSHKFSSKYYGTGTSKLTAKHHASIEIMESFVSNKPIFPENTTYRNKPTELPKPEPDKIIIPKLNNPKDYISSVCQIIQVNRELLSDPKVSFKELEKDNLPFFECTCTITYKSKEIIASSSAKSKKLAKKEVFKKILENKIFL